MLHTRNCKALHEYLNKDQYDVQRLSQMLIEEFGEEHVNKTKEELEAYYKKDIKTLRHYFSLVDARVAEMYQLEDNRIAEFQRQECFILANNFVGPDEQHSNIFVSRYLVPMSNVLENVIAL